ncbi:uncharacterized protein LOC131685068 [Topomyia yanbarensis]|uniref:uncharacterized protein LOC131685068 n=1 Tax=Topomyia yanbarensis TaxID=2498891 RepID=UPI00273AE9AD|nr:uncharacterized protein LOC131685068 [Topomyia yanbarensis]
MFRLAAVLICTLVLTRATQAVVNGDAQRREAPIADSYGVPPSSPGASGPELPAPVYGAPAVAHYPPPLPDIPPPAPNVPHKEYGVPVQNFGPPNINIEYGPPQPPKPVFHHPPKPIYGPPQQSFGHPPPHHSYGPPPRKQSSFLDSLFSTFGFGGEEEHHHQPQHHHQQPQHHYGPPPKPVYGPPAQAYPKPSYGVPSFPQPGPKPVYGPPPQPIYGPPKPAYGPPKPIFSAQQSFGHHSSVHVPPTPPEIKCDGWKPIAGPVIQSSSHAEIHAPESSYGPPPSGDFLGNHQQSHSSGDIGLQLPRLEVGPAFNNDLHGGLDLPKGNSYEIHSNFISDSYGAPPADSYAPGNYKPTFVKLPPQKIQLPPSPLYGAPHRPVSYPGLAISHGSISGNLKPWSGPVAPPRQPIAHRPPVPIGLIESIGHAVEHLDNFGTKPHYSGNVYLPPPTSDVATALPALELNTLPSDQPPKPFLTQHQLPQALPQIQEPRYQEQQIVAVSSECGHGPELSSSHGSSDAQSGYFETSGSQSYSSDVSNSIDTSYGPPASGSAGEFRSSHHLQSSESVSTAESLPGLSAGLGALELVSAQKSQSLTIPVQGKHGSYQLQFQSADPISSGQHGGSVPHEQILSEGLLQSILSAIEQPHSSAHQDESSYDPNIDHSEVSLFLKSPEGQKTLADPPSASAHKR